MGTGGTPIGGGEETVSLDQITFFTPRDSLFAGDGYLLARHCHRPIEDGSIEGDNEEQKRFGGGEGSLWCAQPREAASS